MHAMSSKRCLFIQDCGLVESLNNHVLQGRFLERKADSSANYARVGDEVKAYTRSAAVAHTIA